MKNRFICIELRSLSNAVRRYLENMAPPISGDKLTCSNAWVIGYLAKVQRDVFQRDLEEEFGVTRSTISRALMLLEKKGIIERVGVLSDARLKKLVLTDKGRAIALKMSENGEQMEARLTEGFSDDELATLADYMRRMRANLGDINTEKGEEI